MPNDQSYGCALRALSSGESGSECVSIPCACDVERQLLSDGEREELDAALRAAERLARRTASIEAIFAWAEAQEF